MGVSAGLAAGAAAAGVAAEVAWAGVAVAAGAGVAGREPPPAAGCGVDGTVAVAGAGFAGLAPGSGVEGVSGPAAGAAAGAGVSLSPEWGSATPAKPAQSDSETSAPGLGVAPAAGAGVDFNSPSSLFAISTPRPQSHQFGGYSSELENASGRPCMHHLLVCSSAALAVLPTDSFPWNIPSRCRSGQVNVHLVSHPYRQENTQNWPTQDTLQSLVHHKTESLGGSGSSTAFACSTNNNTSLKQGHDVRAGVSGAQF